MEDTLGADRLHLRGARGVPRRGRHLFPRRRSPHRDALVRVSVRRARAAKTRDRARREGHPNRRGRLRRDPPRRVESARPEPSRVSSRATPEPRRRRLPRARARSGRVDARGEDRSEPVARHPHTPRSTERTPRGVPTLPDPTVYELDISASEYLVDALYSNTYVRVAESGARTPSRTRRGARIAPSPRCTVTSRRARRRDGSTIRTERTTRHLIARRSCWRTR